MSLLSHGDDDRDRLLRIAMAARGGRLAAGPAAQDRVLALDFIS